MSKSWRPAHHDLVLAITSHVPHLIAYNIVGTAADLEDVTRIGGDEILRWRFPRLHPHRRLRSDDVARRLPAQQGRRARNAGPFQRGSDGASEDDPAGRRRRAVRPLHPDARRSGSGSSRKARRQPRPISAGGGRTAKRQSGKRTIKSIDPVSRLDLNGLEDVARAGPRPALKALGTPAPIGKADPKLPASRWFFAPRSSPGCRKSCNVKALPVLQPGDCGPDGARNRELNRTGTGN